MKIKFMAFEQPIGEFAITVMPVRDILRISKIERRGFDQVNLDSFGGPQREASTTRINEIAKYSETADATFPTPILLALTPDSFTIEDEFLVFGDKERFASVVDGQHRLLGLERSVFIDDFVLPVVFILDATEEQKALIFAIINGKQTRVSASIIYDLFSVVEGRNPFKTAHEIARALNSEKNSPFYRRLKMLGRKVSGSTETLSQGTFVTQLIYHISSNPTEDFNNSRANLPAKGHPKAIFNKYYLEDRDEVILKILSNLFTGVASVFPDEWNTPSKFILSKTTGYTGIMRALPKLYELGAENNSLKVDFFIQIFERFKTFLEGEKIILTSEFYPPNSSGEAKLRDHLLSSLRPSVI